MGLRLRLLNYNRLFTIRRRLTFRMGSRLHLRCHNHSLFTIQRKLMFRMGLRLHLCRLHHNNQYIVRLRLTFHLWSRLHLRRLNNSLYTARCNQYQAEVIQQGMGNGVRKI
jgi:hypothetical protein